MRVSHVIVTILYVANVSFNAIHENKILAKISEFTVTLFPPLSLPHLLVYSSSLYCKHYGPDQTVHFRAILLWFILFASIEHCSHTTTAIWVSSLIPALR